MSARDDGNDDYDLDDSNQLQPEDTLDDSEVGDILDRGYSPPEYQPATHEHESLDGRLTEEEPDIAADGAERDPDFPEAAESGSSRAGRLIAPDEGAGQDIDSELVGRDAGIDGAGATAEEAAIHIIE